MMTENEEERGAEKWGLSYILVLQGLIGICVTSALPFIKWPLVVHLGGVSFGGLTHLL